MTRSTLRKLMALSICLTSVCVVAWVNLHTDEPTVVLAFALPFAVVSAALWPALAAMWGLMVGAPVPVSTLLALLLGWRTPYPVSLSTVFQSCIVFLFTVPVSLLSGKVSRALFPPPSRR